MFIFLACCLAYTTLATEHVSLPSLKQAIPLGVIEGSSLAMKNSVGNNASLISSANETADLNKFKEMNNETISSNLYNGTLNNGPYTEIIKQLNQSIPLINSSAIVVANKTIASNSDGKQQNPTLSVINGTELAGKVTNDTLQASKKGHTSSLDMT